MERIAASETTSFAGIVPPAQGLFLAVGDMQVVVKAASEGTRGAFAVLECTLPPDAPGRPLHLHRKTLEAVYVLEGQLAVQMGERKQSIAAGSLAFVPRGVVHTLSNLSATAARFLWVFSPAGMEEYLQEMAKLAAFPGAPAPAEAAQALGERYDVQPA
ncbi:MAG: cupin domain-containing protein [Chloroflexi bacterium]|nr:cupin domain-containing protein [Chloroflexota bacterium]